MLVEKRYICSKFSLPETRSTPFCNHTLHFGGLTTRNLQKNKNNGGWRGKRCCGRNDNAFVTTGRVAIHKHIHCPKCSHCSYSIILKHAHVTQSSIAKARYFFLSSIIKSLKPQIVRGQGQCISHIYICREMMIGGRPR